MSKPGYKLKGSGHPLVMLHSSLSSSNQWHALCDLMQDSHLCINIDLLGYGDAPSVADPDNYSLKTETDRVIEIIDEHTGGGDFAVAGHSFGGAVGLRLAHLMGERITRMAVYEPVAFHLLDKDCEGFREIAQVSGRLEGKADSDAARLFTDYWNNPGFFDGLPGKLKARFSEQMAKVLLDFKGLMGESYTLADCPLEHCPVLVIEGSGSRLSAKTLARLIAEQLPDVMLRTFYGGHMAPVSDSEAVAAMMAKFLKRD